MSEPTYRVELTHHPENGAAVCWTADVYDVSEPAVSGRLWRLADFYGNTLEAAFDLAQEWCRARMQPPEVGRTVFLTEDGDILDPHEVQR